MKAETDNEIYEMIADKDHYLIVDHGFNRSSWHSNTHFHRAMEISVNMNGSSGVYINGEIYYPKQYQIVVLNSFDTHSYDIKKGDEFILALISVDWLNDFYKLYGTEDGKMPTFANILESAEKNRPIIDILLQWCESFKNCNSLQNSGWVNLLLGEMVKQYPIKAEKGKGGLVYEILNCIRSNYHKDVTLEFIARELHCSKSTVSRTFHSIIHEDLRTYVNMLRLEEADNRLVNSNMSVLDIALGCGFESISSFYRAYRNYFGYSPRNKSKTQRK